MCFIYIAVTTGVKRNCYNCTSQDVGCNNGDKSKMAQTSCNGYCTKESTKVEPGE